ncbi:DUF373 family protein [Archaeoglobus veneficus]|uniref:DUF373 family protein n=1 Tax=Archaeoglobus veneficus (strain DSM 11195 / SNP6) TaxID=693661 RepID=F2KN36_ARCVS|nr:DUF373 family protein [Archaeoglobus veneficus]AEA47312.1 protein of unknown function DUF373 [Archaeoglobus veneficus SNP6]
MVKKLVLAIDRDDDLGRKTGIPSPVIGREANIQAAIKLAIADPEDSDVNTMFGAVKIYDELKEKGEDVEVVTVCGDENVGVISDSKIAEQLDMLARKFGATSAIVVTDGSEDEFVLPIISSRFKIDAVSRIIVKQSKTIESTYFLIKRMLNDPKIARMTLTPLGILFLIYSIFLLARYPEWGTGAIIFAIGFYFLIKAYGLEDVVEDYFSTLKKALLEGRMSFIAYVISAILIVIGTIQGLNMVWRVYNQPIAPGVITLITSFIYGSIWWVVAGGIAATFGKIFDLILEKKPFIKQLAIPFLLISTGLVLWGASVFILSGSGIGVEQDSALQYLLFSIFGAVLITLMAIIPLTKRA